MENIGRGGPTSIDSLITYSASANKRQKRQKHFRGICKFVLRRCGIEFNPQLQPTFRSKVHGERAVLPPEIWMSIFHHVKSDALEEICSTSFKNGYGCIRLRSTQLHLAPTLFRQVCRYWNVMITSNPLFWNTIFVYVISKSPAMHLRTWLERSRQAPLSIFFDARSLDYKAFQPDFYSEFFDEASFRRCVDILHQHGPRIRSLHVSLCSDAAKLWTEMLPPSVARSDSESKRLDISQPPNQYLNLDFRTLQAVGIRVADGPYCQSVNGGRSAVEQDLVSRLCSHTTSMMSLELGDRYKDSPYLLGIPLQSQILACPSITGIVFLTLKNTYIKDLSTFFRDLSQLRCLKMLWLDHVKFASNVYSATSDAHLQPMRITLPTLQELRLSTSAVYVHCLAVHFRISPFLKRIAVPSLTTLEIDSKSFDYSTEWSELARMLAASCCTIRALTLISDDESFGYYEACCISSHVFAELEELTFKPRVWMKKIMIRYLDGLQDSFGPLPGREYTLRVDRCALPRLKRLVLYGCLVEDGILGHIAKTRMQGGTLEYLYVEVKDLHPETHSKDIETFRELHRHGHWAYLESIPPSTLRAIDRYRAESWFSKKDLANMDVP